LPNHKIPAHMQVPAGVVRTVLATACALALWAGLNLYGLEAERRALREDVVELSKIKYGIFNVDEWKVIASGIIAKKIDEFDLSVSERKEMRQKISGFLTELIGDLKDRFYDDNKRGVLGFIKSQGASFLGIFDKMERDVPVFTEQILTFLDDPKNRAELKSFLNEKVTEYADRTFSETDYTLHDAILEKRGHTHRGTAIRALQAEEDTLNPLKAKYTRTIYALLALCLLSLLLRQKNDPWEMTFVIATALVALLLGVLLPMIEIDARIDTLAFQLLGEPVIFSDQVLYFKSKSILEVVQLMWAQGKADLLAVGGLVFIFSVVFPMSKMCASVLMVHWPHLQQKGFVRFLVFKTGKWSMADVMVVTIFMSYIGFSGIVSEQLSQLKGIARNADVLTTNQSSLQTGFFMFACFVVLSLGVAQRLSSWVEDDQKFSQPADGSKR